MPKTRLRKAQRARQDCCTSCLDSQSGVEAESRKNVAEYFLRPWPADEEYAPAAGPYQRGELVANARVPALDAVAALNGRPSQASPTSSANHVSWLLDAMAAQDHPTAIRSFERAFGTVVPHPPRSDVEPDGVDVDAILCGKPLRPIERPQREATGIAGVEGVTNDLPVRRVAEGHVTVRADKARCRLLTEGGLDNSCEQEAEEP